VTRVVSSLIATMLIAAIAHIAAVLIVPGVAGDDPGDRLARVAGTGSFALIEPATGVGAPIAGLDPSFVHGACRVPDGAATRIAGALPATIWSLALVDERGIVRQSIDDRAALGGAVDVVAAPATEIARLREVDPETLGAALTLPFGGGVALIRAYAATPAEADAARAAIAGLGCGQAIPSTDM
jgi:uncharacterized membrane protein